MRKSIIELTILQTILILAWLINRTAAWFFPALGVVLLASAGMIIYLLLRWRQLPIANRREGVFAVAGWLVIRANGVTAY